jgi:CxxC motif-containing protein (DUF1111 family)
VRRLVLTLGLTLALGGCEKPAAGGAGGVLLAAGTATVFDTTRNAFSLPMPSLAAEHRASFFVGNSFFNQNWVAAPASVDSRDGLGPLFNARSCSGCHFKDGRGRPPEPGEPLASMLLRVGLPGRAADGAPLPDPTYGDQIQGAAVPGVPAEADVKVHYVEVPGTFADGTPYSLRRPTYALASLGYGPTAPDLVISPRVAPAMVGLGLLEAVPRAVLEALADPEDGNGDGISGRPNLIGNELGRFGWKAEQPSVRSQTAGAFLGDMGITTALHPGENHTAAQGACASQPSGGQPEIDAQILDAVVLYARTLAVPARRQPGDAAVQRGEASFERAGCASCHVPTLHSAGLPGLPELAGQEIHPYSDLLLHDMGPALSDGRPSFRAEGTEWRTPPLWGIGLVKRVNEHELFLHDGRARGFAEAILWHGGEAQRSRDAFLRMSKQERAELVAFLGSL